MPHHGGTAVRCFADYYTVQVLVLHTPETVCSIDPAPRSMPVMPLLDILELKVQKDWIRNTVHNVTVDFFYIVLLQSLVKNKLKRNQY